MPGGRPVGAEQKGRRFKAALLRYADAHPDKLDELAAKLWTTALRCDVQAMRELADRLDGRVPQAVIGGDDDDPPIKLIVTGVKRDNEQD